MFPQKQCPDVVRDKIKTKIQNQQTQNLRYKAFKKAFKYVFVVVILFVGWYLWILNHNLNNPETVVAQEIEKTNQEIDNLLVAVNDDSNRIDFDDLNLQKK